MWDASYTVGPQLYHVTFLPSCGTNTSFCLVKLLNNFNTGPFEFGGGAHKGCALLFDILTSQFTIIPPPVKPQHLIHSLGKLHQNIPLRLCTCARQVCFFYNFPDMWMNPLILKLLRWQNDGTDLVCVTAKEKREM